MTDSPETKIGRIIDVRGGGMVAVLDSSEQGESPKITIGSEDILVGQIGSYVKVIQGEDFSFCIRDSLTQRFMVKEK